MDTYKISINPNRSYLLPFVFAGVFFVLAFIYWSVPGLDKSILTAHNQIFHNSMLLGFFTFITDAGIPFSIIICSVLVYFHTGEKDEKGENINYFLIVVFSLFIAGIMGDVLKLIVGRERPVVELAGAIESIKTHRTLSFPSGHTAKIMGLVIPFVTLPFIKIKYLNVYKGIILLTGVIVAYSRIALQAHFLSDVMGGVAVAFLFFSVSVLLAEKYSKKYGIRKSRNFVIILLCLAFFLAFLEMSL
ncbi:MAG: phosphatase PAP2 family protein [Candidatus Aminicenantes bacterium]|nr:phosphatase PAP2 family protein [Candidatus Aminicenantes bacterium]